MPCEFSRKGPPNFTTGFSEIQRPVDQVTATLLDVSECSIKLILNTKKDVPVKPINVYAFLYPQTI